MKRKEVKVIGEAQHIPMPKWRDGDTVVLCSVNTGIEEFTYTNGAFKSSLDGECWEFIERNWLNWKGYIFVSYTLKARPYMVKILPWKEIKKKTHKDCDGDRQYGDDSTVFAKHMKPLCGTEMEVTPNVYSVMSKRTSIGAYTIKAWMVDTRVSQEIAKNLYDDGYGIDVKLDGCEQWCRVTRWATNTCNLHEYRIAVKGDKVVNSDIFPCKYMELQDMLEYL